MIFMWFSDSCVVFRSQEGPFKAVRAPSNTWHEQFTVHVMVHLTPYQQGRVPIRRATQKSDSSRFRVWVSGFGFRRLKLTLAVRFGIRVSGFVDWNPLSLSVSGFGFRVSSCVDWNPLLLSVFGFRVSSFVDWNPLLLSVSGFGFRVSSIEANFSCPFRDSFFFCFGFLVSSIEANFSCPFQGSGFGFRRSKPPLDSLVYTMPISHHPSVVLHAVVKNKSGEWQAPEKVREEKRQRFGGNLPASVSSCHWVD